MTDRTSLITRRTAETDISLALNLDGSGLAELKSGVPFLDHMLQQVAVHGRFDIKAACKGDLEVDAHHSVEDLGIALGQAFAEALGDKAGILRYGCSYVPLDEALSRVVIDFSGRVGLYFQAEFTRQRVGGFDVDLTREFFSGFAREARVTLHIENLRGLNDHHKIETIFKAFGRACRMAVAWDPRSGGEVPSSKGRL